MSVFIRELTPYLELLITEKLIGSWINDYGSSLKGIVSSGDLPLQLAINNVICKYDREDILRVCLASAEQTLDLIKTGKLHAGAYQNGIMDGALAMQTAVNWFSGLKVEPVRHLPRFIVNRSNVKDFIEKLDTLPELFTALKQLNRQNTELFFVALFLSLQQVKFVKEEVLRVYIIQIFSVINKILKLYGISIQKFLGDYDSNPQTTSNILIDYVDTHFQELLSYQDTLPATCSQAGR